VANVEVSGAVDEIVFGSWMASYPRSEAQKRRWAGNRSDGRSNPTAASREEPAGSLGGPLAGEQPPSTLPTIVALRADFLRRAAGKARYLRGFRLAFASRLFAIWARMER